MRRISPSLVLATIALVLAATGGAVAAQKITGAQIRDGSITGRDIRNRSLTPVDLSRGALSQLTGERGPAGPPGPPGSAGILGLTTVTGADITLSPGTGAGPPVAQCPPGFVVVGTGFVGPFDPPGGFVQAYGNFVGGFFVNQSPIPITAHVQAICAQLAASGAAARTATDPARYRADLAHAQVRMTR